MTTKPMSARAGAMSRNMRLKLGLLTGTASLALIAAGAPALAQAPAAAPAAVEEIVVTGSLIRGVPTVGVPVTTLGAQQFAQQAAVTVSDLFRAVPALDVIASTAHGANGSNLTRAQRANIHLQGAARTLMLIDGLRFPLTGVYSDGYDPSIVPAIALQQVDVLATGASAVYGSDAIAGVMNLILRRNFDGATTQVMRQFGQGGGSKWQVSQLFGRTWDAGGGGGVTGSIDYQYESALPSSARDFITWDFSRYGLDNRQPLRSSIPATVTLGNPALPSANANPVGFSGSGCTNCLLVPAGQNGVGLTWARLLANPMVPQTATAQGTNNLVDPHRYSDYLSNQKRISGALTFNQQLTDNIELFADFLFHHRRVDQKISPSVNPWIGASFASLIVPRENPYFPAGTPAGALRANYSTALELNITSKARETSRRWDVGFNIDLPYDWRGKVVYANNLEKNRATIINTANTNNVLAALGNIAGDPDGQIGPYMVGTGPRSLTAADIAANRSLSAYTPGTPVRVISPTQVPFLNVFCDPTAFQCNDQRTLDFIKAHWIDDTSYQLQQLQFQADGPLFALPGGMVRGAVGGSWVKEGLDAFADRNQSLATAEIRKPVRDFFNRTYYSAFGQLNIPLVSEEMNIPLVSRLNVELSGRYDDYSDFGSTTNPRVSADWSLIPAFTLRGSWGKSFAAPAFQYLGVLAGKNISAINIASGGPTNTLQVCTPQQVSGSQGATPGSAAADILAAIGAANCSDGAISAALAAQAPGSPYAGYNLSQIRNPGGLSQNGGAAAAYGLTRPAGGTLGPEEATNWSLGFSFAPDSGVLGFMRGLDVNATYWNVTIENFIGGPSSNNNELNDPEQRQYLVVKGADRNNPVGTFNQALASYLASPALSSGVTPNAGTISYVRDSMVRNLYRQAIDGVDFAVTYTRDFNSLGEWTAGVNGTYYLHYNTRNLVTENPRDQFDSPTNAYGVSGNTDSQRFIARAQLGWQDPSRTIDVNAFMNYRSGYINPQQIAPTPTIENQLGVPQGSLSGAALTKAQQNFMSVPSFTTFDMSVGFNLGERTASRWLEGTMLRLTVNNIFDKQPPFFYRTQNGGAGPVPFDPTAFNPLGRVIAIQATKNW